MILDKHSKEIIFGVSGKYDGRMNARDDVTIKNSRKRFFAGQNIDVNNLVIGSLVHSSNVAVVNNSSGGQIIKDTDGLITNTKGVYLAVTVADCLPIFFYDPKNKVVGIVHAGWRGVLNGIAVRAIEPMVGNFQSKSENILVYVGPHIRKCHFEVKGDVAIKFKDYPGAIYKQDDKIFIDLSKVVISQLIDQKLKLENIEISSECTYCQRDKYFSYRRDRPEIVESQIAYIGLK